MPSQKRKFGDIGETMAADFLLKNGYKILERNYRVKNIGEIDLIGEKDNKITFFEVKTRDKKYETCFPIETSINKKKRQNLKKICQLYLAEHGYPDKEWQVDAIFIRVDSGGRSEIEHFENVLWESYY